MKKFSSLMKAIYKGEEGAAATEYILLIAFMAFLIVVGMTVFGGAVNDSFSSLGNELETQAGQSSLPTS